MIDVINLSKQFNKHTVVDAVTLNVEDGQIFGLLGPNAAGKTTVIRMLCGLINSDKGEVRINGMNNKNAKADIGYVSQHFGQYEELSVWENLNFYAQMYGVKNKSRLSSLLQRYDLMPFINQRAGLLSGGYQRRLALTCALAHDPKVLFLDEPTAGIDPVTRKTMWDDLYMLSGEGKTLFITTHYMEEAQRCHQLAFISKGKIVAKGTPSTIKLAIGDVRVYITKLPFSPDLHNNLLDMEGVILVNQFGDELRTVVTPKLNRSKLETVINSITGKPCSLELDEPNLEDTFIALTQDS
jgi:ABC-2 type transport system ATP-binding protein